jgi:pyruvate dehydrogenase E2 component (dihydrolipoamide acetyltransferase)
MAHPILMPKPGQMTEECTLVAWLKKPGDQVHRGDVLFEIETDKSNMDVEAFEEGVLLRTYVDVGQTVPVNSVVAYVGQPGEDVPDKAPSAPAGDGEAGVAVESPKPGAVGPPMSGAAVASGASAAPAVSAAAETAAASAAPAGGEGRIRISPRASRLAASSGIDPRTIVGTGPEGRITESDVRAALAAAKASPLPAASAVAVSPGAPLATAAPAFVPAMFAGEDEEGPHPLSRMRQVIAERLTLSATTVPQFTVTVAVDMTELLALRAELNASGAALSVTDFILAAAAHTLVEFPEVNSRTDGTSVWIRKRVHLGLAVSVPNGLVVPVIRDAHRLTLTELHDRAAALATAAREGALSPDQMTGSTFTISNLGMFGVDEFSAIINPGESAILAVSSIVPTPVAIGDALAVRQMMKMTISADHRLVDGELAARFLDALRRRLTDVEAFRVGALNS